MKAQRLFGWFLGFGIVTGTLWIVRVSSLYYVDLPSLLIVGGLTLGVGLASHGGGVFRVYSIANRGGSAQDLQLARAVFRLFSRALGASAGFSILMGIIAMLSFPLDDYSFARGLGTVLIGPLYAFVFYLFGVLPFASRVDAQLVE